MVWLAPSPDAGPAVAEPVADVCLEAEEFPVEDWPPPSADWVGFEVHPQTNNSPHSTAVSTTNLFANLVMVAPPIRCVALLKPKT